MASRPAPKRTAPPPERQAAEARRLLPVVSVRTDLRADCEHCFALCCVALPFAKSADFAAHKAGGEPCRNLDAALRCSIHDRLRGSGYGGCAVFDCFGAGQKLSQHTFGGRDWRTDPEVARPMFTAFPVLRQLHELLWYLHQAIALPGAQAVHPRLRQAMEEVEAAAGADADTLARTDIAALREKANPVLQRASELVRAELPGPHRDHRGADLVGARLAGADLRASSLRGALLLGADLRRADLRGADVTGADFRGAKLAGADLSACLFLTQAQLNAASGDRSTRIPAGYDRPAHWT